jgi:hypothetical protein
MSTIVRTTRRSVFSVLVLTLAASTLLVAGPAKAATVSDDTSSQFGAGSSSGVIVAGRSDGEIALSVGNGFSDSKVNGSGSSITVPISTPGTFDNVPRVVTDKYGTLYAVFTGTVAGIHSAFFVGSRDGGVSWDGDLLTSAIEAPTMLPKNTTQSGDNDASFLPDIAVDDSVSPPRIYVVFLDDRAADAFGNDGLSAPSDVYVTSSATGASGATWTSIQQVNTLTSAGLGAGNNLGSINGGPRIALSPTNSDMYLVWNNDPSVFSDYNIYFSKADRTPTDGAFVFGSEVRIDDNSGTGDQRISGAPSIAVDASGKVYVAYEDTRDSVNPGGTTDSEIRMTAFTPTGTISSPPAASIEVHSDPGGDGVTDTLYSKTPEIVIQNGSPVRVFIAFEQETTGVQTMISRSTDGGTTFPAADEETLPGSGNMQYPDILLDMAGNPLVTRTSIAAGTFVSNRSTDGGTSYAGNVQVNSGAPGTAWIGSLASNPWGDFVAVWRDTRESGSLFSWMSTDGSTWGQRYGGTGTFTSRVIDLGDDSSNPGNFTADRQLLGGGFTGSTGTSIKFQFRGASSAADVASQPFSGPDGTASSFYSGTSVQALESTSTNLDGKRYVQYQATLTNINGGAGSGLTPVLHSISLEYGADASLTRIAGSDRYKTSVAISANRFAAGSANALVVASGETFADALPGGPLSGVLSGPLLLTKKGSLPFDVAGEITRVLAADSGDTDVYLLGGPAAITTAVESAITTLRPDIGLKRIGGTNRVHTSRLIAEEMDLIRAVKGLPAASKAFLSVSTNFPDALAASSPGSSSTVDGSFMSILLTGTGALDPMIKEYLQAKSGSLKTVYATGGTAALSAATIAEADAVIETVERLFGADRYATATAIDGKFFTGSLAPTCISVPTGENFPDALSGGSHAGSKSCPIVLVKKTGLPSATSAYVSGNAASIGGGFVYGGTAVVPDTIKSALESIY